MKENAYAEKRRFDRAPLWKGKKGVLPFLDMELTERCNNNCIHCYINRPTDDAGALKGELATKEIKRILREAESLGCLGVKLTGGEPLLREDFKELYLFARRLGLRVTLLTNGTCITPPLAKLFAKIPPLEYIEITSYGMNKDSYEAVTRVSGAFAAHRRGINLLLENNVPFLIKGTVLPPNRDEVQGFEEWAGSFPWNGESPDYPLLLDLRCRRDSQEKNHRIQGLRLSPVEVIAFLAKWPREFEEETRKSCARVVQLPGNRLFSCGAGMGAGCVDAYGLFQPCMTLRHPETVYDLRKGTLADAIMNFFPNIRKIEAENSQYLARCARCFLKSLCEQCPARSWMEHGTLDTPVEYFCEIAHAKGRFLGLLKADEKAWEVENWKDRTRVFLGDDRPVDWERSAAIL